MYLYLIVFVFVLKTISVITFLSGITQTTSRSRVGCNFAELQKGCKIVLTDRSAPYLGVVTNDKYCTSCSTSYCSPSPPDQRLYSSTARLCVSVSHNCSTILYCPNFSSILDCCSSQNDQIIRIDGLKNCPHEHLDQNISLFWLQK